jgi:hypothetical protein
MDVDRKLIEDLIDSLQNNTPGEVIRRQANVISEAATDVYLKAVVGSIFDTMETKDVIQELKAYLKGFETGCLPPI